MCVCVFVCLPPRVFSLSSSVPLPSLFTVGVQDTPHIHKCQGVADVLFSFGFTVARASEAALGDR